MNSIQKRSTSLMNRAYNQLLYELLMSTGIETDGSLDDVLQQLKCRGYRLHETVTNSGHVIDGHYEIKREVQVLDRHDCVIAKKSMVSAYYLRREGK